MTKEKLIALGISEELVDKVINAYKEAIDGNYIPKSTFEAEREKVKDLTSQVSDRDKQIEELKKFEGDNEKLKKQIESIEADNKKQKEDYENKIVILEQDSILSAELTPLVNDISDILPKIDREKLIFKDGKVSGLDEQVAEIKKVSPHYFKTDDGGEGGNGGGNPGWNPFGHNPKEGNDPDGGKNTDKDFGATLAKSIHGGAVGDNGDNNYYFK
jgi:predicted RNase H-like nuclease (RuvC/YqgF family)